MKKFNRNVKGNLDKYHWNQEIPIIVHGGETILTKKVSDKIPKQPPIPKPVQKEIIRLNNKLVTVTAKSGGRIKKINIFQDVARGEDDTDLEKSTGRVKLEDPYDFQDKNQEEIVHSPISKGGSFLHVLEGSGDIFREVAKQDKSLGWNKPAYDYVNEKMNRTENAIKREKGESLLHPIDSYNLFATENPSKLKLLRQGWILQPVNTASQSAAKSLNIAMSKGDFNEADNWAKIIRKRMDKHKLRKGGHVKQKVLTNKKVKGRGAGWHEQRLNHSNASVKGKMKKWRR